MSAKPAFERLERRSLMAVYALDPTFGVAGRVTMAEQTSGLSPNVSFVHALPDRSVLAGGVFDNVGGRIFKFTEDGSLDTAFGGGDGATAFACCSCCAFSASRRFSSWACFFQSVSMCRDGCSSLMSFALRDRTFVAGILICKP